MVTKEEGKQIWLSLVKKHVGFSESLKIDLKHCRDKLVLVKFTRNGAMVKIRNGRVDKRYNYAKSKFGALVKMYEEIVEAKNNG